MWFRPKSQTNQQVVKVFLVEHFTTILPFKHKNWVFCHQTVTLEEAMMLMEAYSSAKVGLYFILKIWKRKTELQRQQAA